MFVTCLIKCRLLIHLNDLKKCATVLKVMNLTIGKNTILNWELEDIFKLSHLEPKLQMLHLTP